MTTVRMPTQKRSIEKRDNIIEKGFKLMCEKGYYNTTTTDIAEYANVSVGIIYQYFNDKKDIFIEGVKKYSNDIMYPILKVLDDDTFDLYNISKLLDEMVKRHTFSLKEHEEISAMTHLDKEVGEIFRNSELIVSNKIVNYLEKKNYNIPNMLEKVHIIMQIIDDYCHEMVYHKHDEINYDIMKDEIIKMIKRIIK